MEPGDSSRIPYDWSRALPSSVLFFVTLKAALILLVVSKLIDLDSTEDPAHGKQEGVAYNRHFAKNCFHPLFGFTSEGDCLGARLRPGNVHSAEGALEFIKPTYFIRLPGNENLDKLVASHLSRPPKSGIQVKVVDLQYQAKSWHKPRRVVAKIEWHHFKKQEELLP